MCRYLKNIDKIFDKYCDKCYPYDKKNYLIAKEHKEEKEILWVVK